MKHTKQDTLLAVRVSSEVAAIVRTLASADERSLSSFIKLAIKNEIRRAQERQSHRDPIAA